MPTEMGHVADTLARIAMGRPDVRFRLLHNDKTVKAWSAVSDPALRVADVLGSGPVGDLLPVAGERSGAAVSGWLLSGRTNRSTSRGIYIYVNNRFVKDRVIRHAVITGFSGRLMKGRFPVAALLSPFLPIMWMSMYIPPNTKCGLPTRSRCTTPSQPLCRKH